MSKKKKYYSSWKIVHDLEVNTIELLAKWYLKWNNWAYSVVAILVILFFLLLLDIPRLNDWFCQYIFRVNDGHSVLSILGQSVPVLLLLFIVIIAAWDFMAWSFERMGEFSYPDKWEISGALAVIKKHPPKSDREAAKNEMELLRHLSHQVKYTLLQLTIKIVLAAFIFITSFALIYTLLDRYSANGCQSAFTNIDTNSGVLWHFFYSIDLVTSLGGAAPTPNVHFRWIWIFSGIELFFTIVFVILFLTLAVSSIYEVFNFKTTYFSAFLRYEQIRTNDKELPNAKEPL